MEKRIYEQNGLSFFLENNKNELLTEWIDFNNIQQTGPEDTTRDYRNHVFNLIIEYLLDESDAEIGEELSNIKSYIIRGDYEISDLICEIFNFKHSFMSISRCSLEPGGPKTLRVCEQLDSRLGSLISHLTKEYATLMNKQLRIQKEHTEKILEIVSTAASTLDLDEVLDCVRDVICTLTDTPCCGFYLIDKESSLLIPHRIADGETGSLNLLEYPEVPHQLLSNVIEPGRRILKDKVPVIFTSKEIQDCIRLGWKHFKGFKSLLAVPFTVKGRIVAIAHVCSYDENRVFTEEQIAKTWGIANAVALAIENARLHNKVKAIAVMEERERLAREMHDNLAQTIGAMQLKASQADKFIERDQTDDAQKVIGDLQEIISEAYTDVREIMFNIRLAPSPTEGFIKTIKNYIADYRSRYGLEIELIAPEELQAAWKGDMSLQVMHIIQEAVTNIRKHAKTSYARIKIENGLDSVNISIIDHGCGFTPLPRKNYIGRHMGLVVMAERAESINGTLKLESEPGKGSRITLSLPL